MAMRRYRSMISSRRAGIKVITIERRRRRLSLAVEDGTSCSTIFPYRMACRAFSAAAADFVIGMILFDRRSRFHENARLVE